MRNRNKWYQNIDVSYSGRVPLLGLMTKPVRSLVLQPYLPLVESCFDKGLKMVLLAHTLKAKPNYSVDRQKMTKRFHLFYEKRTFKSGI